MAATEKSLAALIDSADGYIASYRDDKSTAMPTAHWTVRLPAANFKQFTADVLELGVPISRQSDAQDVTEQYIDLTARLHNKQRMEQRILKLLEERKEGLSEILSMESQLARIREEIESLEGKVRHLSDRVAMTTVTITVRENQRYFPASPPTFATKVADTLQVSLAAMQQLGEEIVLGVVAIAPWLLAASLLLGLPIVVCIRLRRAYV